MKIKFKKDNRDKLWAKLELEIQKRGSKKDKQFVLTGKWKKLVRNQEGFKVFKVDGERFNLLESASSCCSKGKRSGNTEESR